MVSIQSLRHEIKVSSVIRSFSKPFDNYIIECYMPATVYLMGYTGINQIKMVLECC